jgi:predicted PurR-regulated permease PerM
MSRTVKVNPLLVLLSLLIGTSIGDWIGGFFGSFVAALLSIPVAGALQVITRELWQATAWPGPPDSEPPPEPGLAVRNEQASETDRRLRDGEQELTQ